MTDYKTENVHLMRGDCLERMKEIPSGSVDMILTDPPYGMNFQSNRRVAKRKFEKIANDNTLEWVESFIGECHRVMTENSAIYLFCSWHHIDHFKLAIERKFKLKNMIVWVKNNHGSGDLRGGYAPQHEIVFYACKGRVLNRGKRLPDVIYADKIPSAKLIHPAEKNTSMLSVFVNQHTDSEMAILDPFMGSGSTGVACVNTGRKFIGIELDDKYFEIAKNRIKEASKVEDAA